VANRNGGSLGSYDDAAVNRAVEQTKKENIQKAHGHVSDVADAMFGRNSDKLPMPKPADAGGTKKLKYSKRAQAR
jgi:hypothetical protein